VAEAICNRECGAQRRARAPWYGNEKRFLTGHGICGACWTVLSLMWTEHEATVPL
jgi:hypothetical protein